MAVGGEEEALLKQLETRFKEQMQRHPDVDWKEVERRLREQPDALAVLKRMEQTGGEPDLVTNPDDPTVLTFFDCAKESPKERRSGCYDQRARETRKKNPPATSALEQAAEIGISVLTEAQYRLLQTIEPVDLKTSSWVATPSRIRDQGGALYCDRRYDTVFVYHNGADSYYASRGFRGCLTL
ncbi:DUF4256 domain-containing protein [Exiguobacterium sp. s193]|uniref:DUF4256 domain-containing protein n=1 Tax=Exiguobacterium sp. s193 TaxID=2751207 RepID=UPI002037187C|nr:DUF4256 domain-containing protein [Exiguobacterium sp. s193]